jgi:mannosyltransferase OCH1-like enzyme
MSESSIPKIFHQIWLGGTEMPVPFQVLREHCLSLHPDWDYKLWTDDNLPPLINSRLYDAQNRAFYKADVLRYEILAAHGGVYLDTDFLIYKNIEPLLRNTDHFLAYEAVDWICNSIMGFAPNHHFLWKLIAEAPSRSRKYWDRWGVDRIGPGLMTACAAECTNMLILPRAIFYPMGPHDVRQKQFDTHPQAFGAHLWNDMLGLNGIQVWRTLPAAKKYENQDWTLEELQTLAQQAPSQPQKTAGMNPQSAAEIRHGSRLS